MRISELEFRRWLFRSEWLIDSPDGRPAFRPLEADREGFFALGESIAFDPDHDRFADRFAGQEGESLFDAQGAPTASLKAVQNALGRDRKSVVEGKSV